jgi:hypothetical protein
MLTIQLLEAWPNDRVFQIREVFVWEAGLDLQPSGYVSNPAHEFTPSIGNAIDMSNTFWMSQPGEIPETSILDLGEICRVRSLQVVWSLRPTFYNDDLFSYSVDGVEWSQLSTEIRPFEPAVEDFIGQLELRYLRIYLTAPYSDELSPPTAPVWSVGIRNLDLKLDINVARAGIAVAPQGSWDFPTHWAFDGLDSTFWMSRYGVEQATLTIDLGEDNNLAGVTVNFVHRPRFVEFQISSRANCATVPSVAGGSRTSGWSPIYAVSGNQELVVEVPSTIHARARCIRAYMETPLDLLADPQGGDPVGVFAVRHFGIYDHKGGGGVFGVETCRVIEARTVCGRRFDTIGYGLTQPRRWEMISEGFERTRELDNINVLEKTNKLVHIVAVFDNKKISLYRNGVLYGKEYEHTSEHVSEIPDGYLRLVFGIRSSAFVGESVIGDYSETLRSISGPETTLNQYYSGKTKSVSLIKGALMPEEVLGLYEAGFNEAGSERGCHCYDACPFGFNNLYPDIPVPCSGQGVCRRDLTRKTSGYCQCVLGYSGVACEFHCSELGGCCYTDDDCEVGRVCDATTQACAAV